MPQSLKDSFKLPHEIQHIFDIVPNVLQHTVTQGQPYIEKYGIVAIAASLFAETLLFTGFWFPGVTILIAAGFMAASGVIPVIPTLLSALLGAVLGDQLSYFVGYFFGTRVLKLNKKYIDLVRKSLEEEGNYLLLVYHYSPFLRPIIPCIAGNMRYRLRKWIIFDILGVSIWVFLFFIIGYITQNTFRSQGNILLISINALSALLIVFLPLRLGRRFFKLRKNINNGHADANPILETDSTTIPININTEDRVSQSEK